MRLEIIRLLILRGLAGGVNRGFAIRGLDGWDKTGFVGCSVIGAATAHRLFVGAEPPLGKQKCLQGNEGSRGQQGGAARDRHTHPRP